MKSILSFSLSSLPQSDINFHNSLYKCFPSFWRIYMYIQFLDLVGTQPHFDQCSSTRCLVILLSLTHHQSSQVKQVTGLTSCFLSQSNRYTLLYINEFNENMEEFKDIHLITHRRPIHPPQFQMNKKGNLILQRARSRLSHSILV